MADKQDDVEALLASLTEPTSVEQKRQEPSSDSELRNFGERNGSFKIDPRDSHLTGTDKLRKDSKALAVNPEDFTDHLVVKNDAKRRKMLLVGLGLTIFLLVLGYVGYNLVQSTTAQATFTIPNSGTEEQRFLNLFPNAPAPNTMMSTTAEATPTGVAIPGGYALTFAGMDFQSLDYEAIAGGDFGPAAVANVAGDWNGTTVYLFKDMAHTKAFAKAWNGAPVTVEGSPAAAVMLMKLSTGVHAVVAIVNPDSTGFMIVLPQNLNYASAENLKSFVRIEKSQLKVGTTANPVTTVTPANFGNKCSPQYGVSLLKIIGGNSDNDSLVNTVTVPWQDGNLLGVKLKDGELRLKSVASVYEAADAQSYDLIGKILGENGIIVEPDPKAGDTYAELANTDELKIVESCLQTINPPQ